MTGAYIRRISTAPIKGFALSHPPSINLTPFGAEGDRSFFLVDDKGSLVSITKTGNFAGFVVEYSPSTSELIVRAPDGSVIQGKISLGERIDVDFWGHHQAAARIVTGRWAAWFSDRAAQSLRLVKACAPGGGMDVEPVTLLGAGTVEALRAHAQLEDLDDRRFRMLLSFSGPAAHAEEFWMNRDFWIGAARIQVKGRVKRCAAVTRHPETGKRDLPLLRMMKRHRGLQDSVLGTGVCLGVYATVIVPGTIQLGDEIIAAD